MAPQNKSRRRSARDLVSASVDLGPIVQRVLRLLENSPRGASRVDILAAMSLHQSAWTTLREALEDTGLVSAVGRGPGLRHVHVRFLDKVPEEARQQRLTAERSEQLDQARHTLRDTIRSQRELDSNQAQQATGLRADPVRRLLLELVDEGVVERSGKKRSTRYRWVG